MSDVAIRVEGVGKKYQLGLEKSLSLMDVFKFSKSGSKERDEFWALKDVSFEVKHGEAIGIIGRNGAGKSTLLKILSRITHPTTGRFEMNGRVSSLLEVGTGFHPELSGRENIFLNGTILGMRRKEVQAKFDEIVDFSGVEQFIDTPVKRYSSGMKVRLAFAVAAHLEPEILIIDEVLAVGDAEFQKKCLGKMEDVTGAGRTVLFVSHNMNAIRALCGNGILLNGGSIQIIDNAEKVTKEYLAQNDGAIEIGRFSNSGRVVEGPLRFTGLDLFVSNKKASYAPCGADVSFHLTMETDMEIDTSKLEIDIGIDNLQAERIAWLSTKVARVTNDLKAVSRFSVGVEMNRLSLLPGLYKITLFSRYNGEIVDRIANAYQLEVVAGDFYGSGKLNNFNNGKFQMDHSFEYEKTD